MKLWLLTDTQVVTFRNCMWDSMTFILDEERRPVPATMDVWTAWMKTARRSIAVDAIGKSEVSTVFMGLDHSWDGGPPVLWETMVFGGALDGEQERYCSEDEALAGHAAMVARVRKAEQP